MSNQTMLAVMLAVAVVQPNPRNLREVKEDDAQRELRFDIRRRGVLVPLLVRRNGEVYPLIDGHRRLAACRSLGMEQVPCVVFEREMSEAEVREAQLVTQLHSQALTPFQVYVGCKNWLELHPGSSAKDLAIAISKSEPAVSMTLSLAKCTKRTQEAAQANQIGLSDWYKLSQLPQEQQDDALMARLRGEPMDKAKRSARGVSQPVVKMPKIKIPLATDMATGCVVVSGENLDLDDTENLLKEALKAVRAAKDKNLDCKTAQLVWKDMAKAE